MKKWSNTEIGLALSLVALFGLTFSMLIVERYFSIEELSDMTFGLSGIYDSGSFSTYSELDSECDSSHSLASYCGNFKDLESAGRAFQIVLIFDIFVLLLFILAIIGIRLLLKKLVTQVLEESGLKPSLVSLAKWVVASRLIIFFHPFLLVLGSLYWASEGGISDLSGTLKSEVGIILAIVHGMFSLAFSAAYAYYISSSKRRNILHMLDTQIKRQRKNTRKLEGTKIDLYEVSLDF